MFPSLSQVTSVGLANVPPHERDQSLRIEFHHHVGAFVDHPDVVILVDFDGVGERETIGVLSPLLNEFSGLIEFE